MSMSNSSRGLPTTVTGSENSTVNWIFSPGPYRSRARGLDDTRCEITRGAALTWLVWSLVMP